MVPHCGVAPGAAPRLVARFDIGPAFEEHLHNRGFAPARSFDQRRASLGIADVDVRALADEEFHGAPLLHRGGRKQRRGSRPVLCLETPARREQRPDSGCMAGPRSRDDRRVDVHFGPGLLEQPDDLQIAARGGIRQRRQTAGIRRVGRDARGQQHLHGSGIAAARRGHQCGAPRLVGRRRTRPTVEQDADRAGVAAKGRNEKRRRLFQVAGLDGGAARDKQPQDVGAPR